MMMCLCVGKHARTAVESILNQFILTWAPTVADGAKEVGKRQGVIGKPTLIGQATKITLNPIKFNCTIRLLLTSR